MDDIIRLELAELRRALDEYRDENVRYRRMLDDMLYNLDTENMPAVQDLIRRYREAGEASAAAIALTADENGAAINALAIRQDDTEESIAGLYADASATGAAVSSLAAWRTTATENIAALRLEADSQSAKIGLVVDSEDNLRGAEIVAAVNAAGSSVKIAAEKINFDGVATFARTDDLASGRTVISGGCLTVENFVNSHGIKLDGDIIFNAGSDPDSYQNRKILFGSPDGVRDIYIGAVGNGRTLYIASVDDVIIGSCLGEVLVERGGNTARPVVTTEMLPPQGYPGTVEVQSLYGDTLTFTDGILTGFVP